MKLEDFIIRISIVFIVVGIGILLFLIIFTFITFTQDQSIKKDFCNDRGYEFRSLVSDCYKIQNDKIISKDILIIDGEVYFEE